MAAQPTGRPGLVRIPAPNATKVEVRFAPLAQRDKFAPHTWPVQALTRSAPAFPGWWEIDLDVLGLADGPYEYEFVLDDGTGRPIADPFADEITRFGGYRGVLRMSGGERVEQSFRWDDEFTPGKRLPQNNEMVIYEMPVRWMASDPQENPVATAGPLVDRPTYDPIRCSLSLGLDAFQVRVFSV